MTQASQQLPSWLTLSATTITEPDGSLSTSFATLRLPLTYFGPSIPLGTDGVWTYGGLTPPPTNSPEPTSATPSSTISASTISTISTTPSSTSTPPSTSGSSLSTVPSNSPSESSPTTVAPSTTSFVPTAATSHGISTAILGAILGSILGAMLLLVIVLSLCLLRRNAARRRRLSNPNVENTGTSSFWNADASAQNPDRRSTPIWTGWEVLDPEGTEENGRPASGMRHVVAAVYDEPHTPGEGSPRGSGEEADPFLTRRSLKGPRADEKMREKPISDALVSVPAAAVVGGALRSSPPRGGHIIPREVQRRIAEEEDAQSPYSIRVVEPSPYTDHSPLLPPPPLDPDGLGGLGVRAARRHSDRSIGSQKTQGHSLHSEKSTNSFDADPPELLVARRVRVSEMPPSHSRLATIESEASTSGPSRSALGLSGIGGALSRLSWFKRSSTGAAHEQDFTIDPYTRTPTRSSRHGSSRPGSQTRLLDDADVENAGSRRSRHDSGLGFGLLNSASRPISSVSAKSQASASGNSVYYDARSRPTTPAIEFPVPVTSRIEQERLASAPIDGRVTLSDSYFDSPSNPPPAYDEGSLPRLRGGHPSSEIDILDLPAPPPASPFSSSRPEFPPGLIPLPYPRTWRDSYATDDLSPVSRESAGITIDIEDEPPIARESWRDLATERDGRRRTFGTPNVVQPGTTFSSEHPSVHSLRSHLRPDTSRSASRSAPSSGHSQGGSASSRPSAHSQGLSVRSDPSYISASDEGHPGEVGELRSPPLSAVMGSFGSQQSHPPRATSRLAQPSSSQPPNTYVTPASSRAPLLGGGTVTSSTTTGTAGTGTNSSVTTALTDPITGTVMHFPSLPWMSERPTIRRVESWQELDHEDDERW